MNTPRFFLTDVFTARRYGGNPLATFVDCQALTEQEMQQIAKEINFSETTFITSRAPKNGGYDVRIFTPRAEIEFAGHPTLGTAYVIREKLRLTTAGEVSLNLRAGRVPVSFADGVAHSPLLWMKQLPAQFGARVAPDVIAPVLGVPASDIDLGSPIEEVSTGLPTLIVPLREAASLAKIRIDKDRYFDFAAKVAKVILVYGRGGYEPEQDLSVRVFADFYGIPEDAATGSSNGALAAYLLRHAVLGPAPLAATVGQGYAMDRPSQLALRASTTSNGIEVHVGGSVVAIAEGTWG